MSNGTIRLHESAIKNGRVGTARIREEIAGAAACLSAREPVDLDPSIDRMVGDARLNTRRAGMPAHTAASAKHRANAGNGEKPAVGNRETPPGGSSPLERMHRLGRLGAGRMNKTEAAYAETLAARLHVGEILWFRFESHKLRLADNTFYTPDFSVIVANGALEYHEVKGHWTDKARVKTKTAAAQFPHRFIAVKRAGRHGWKFEDMTSKNW